MSEAISESPLPENSRIKKEIPIKEAKPEIRQEIASSEQTRVDTIADRFAQLLVRYDGKVDLQEEKARIEGLVEESKKLTSQYLEPESINEAKSL